MMVLVAMVILASVKVLQDTVGGKVGQANEQVNRGVSTESAEQRDERRRHANAKKAADQTGASEGGQAADGSGSGTGDDGQKVVDAPEAPRGPGGRTDQAAASSPGGCGGFNPFIIPIALGLLGLLGYIFMKTKKG
ncbi:MAG: hypothetical protein ACLFVJ_13060 [Persicimonas sp.]